MDNVADRKAKKRPYISRVEDLPNFDIMGEEELTLWWENHEVSAEVMATFPKGDLEADLIEMGLDPNDY